MTYAFPPSLYVLRDYLRSQGADTIAFVSARQAAFMAQQLLGTRVKFPAQGKDMTATLFLIQKAVTEKGAALKINTSAKGLRMKGKKGNQQLPYREKKNDYSSFKAELFAKGFHIFCDGAAVPNPGLGGWGVVTYHDGDEVNCSYGGDPATTNNQMELTAILNAIQSAGQLSGNSGQLVTVWCDSQYCVKGVNEWMKGWKANGWNRKKLNSPNRTEGAVANLDLWKAIDEAVTGYSHFGDIEIRWVKGHIGVAGNERADELAEIGRQQVQEMHELPRDDLDECYRQIMGAM